MVNIYCCGWLSFWSHQVLYMDFMEWGWDLFSEGSAGKLRGFARLHMPPHLGSEDRTEGRTLASLCFEKWIQDLFLILDMLRDWYVILLETSWYCRWFSWPHHCTNSDRHPRRVCTWEVICRHEDCRQGQSIPMSNQGAKVYVGRALCDLPYEDVHLCQCLCLLERTRNIYVWAC